MGWESGLQRWGEGIAQAGAELKLGVHISEISMARIGREAEEGTTRPPPQFSTLVLVSLDLGP